MKGDENVNLGVSDIQIMLIYAGWLVNARTYVSLCSCHWPRLGVDACHWLDHVTFTAMT